MERQRRCSDPSDSPVNQHPPTTLQPFCYKSVTSCEMLYDILILDIVNVHDMMFERLEQLLVKWETQG